MNERTLRVLQITDTHLYADPEAALWECVTQTSLQAVLDTVAAELPADLVLATGDLVHDGSASGYRRVDAALRALKAPVWYLPGNHDDPAVLAAAIPAAPHRYPAVKYLGGWRFLLLNSTVPDSEGGHLDAPQLDAVSEALAADTTTPTLVALHHNPVPVGSAWLDTMTVDNGAELLTRLADHRQVRAVVWGHIHQPYDQRQGHLRLVGTPSTCVQFLPGSAQFALDASPPGWRWLWLEPDGSLDTAVTYLPR